MNTHMRKIIMAVLSITAALAAPAAVAQSTKPESKAAAATDAGSNTVGITPIGQRKGELCRRDVALLSEVRVEFAFCMTQ